MPPPKVVIVMARCSRNRQDFGIRFQEASDGQWAGTWAFAIAPSAAQREGYVRTELRGSFEFSEAYPGCPLCGARNIFKCPCGKVACWDTETRTVVCPWCDHRGQLEGVIDGLGSAGDR